MDFFNKGNSSTSQPTIWKHGTPLLNRFHNSHGSDHCFTALRISVHNHISIVCWTGQRLSQLLINVHFSVHRNQSHVFVGLYHSVYETSKNEKNSFYRIEKSSQLHGIVSVAVNILNYYYVIYLGTKFSLTTPWLNSFISFPHQCTWRLTVCIVYIYVSLGNYVAEHWYLVISTYLE